MTHGGGGLHLLSTHCLSRHPLPFSLNAVLRAPHPRRGAGGAGGKRLRPPPLLVPALTPRWVGWGLCFTSAQTPERKSLTLG